MLGSVEPISPIPVIRRPRMLIFCPVAWLYLWIIVVLLATLRTQREHFNIGREYDSGGSNWGNAQFGPLRFTKSSAAVSL